MDRNDELKEIIAWVVIDGGGEATQLEMETNGCERCHTEE
jgi:hypothetical protein